MIRVRKSEDRGTTRLGWLQSYHSFSFNQYYDPEHVHFGPLRVLNDDRVSPGTGFGLHPHNDMEIVTYVLEGELEHQDSTGTQGVIRSGEVQHMSAGTGIMHSEYNHSSSEPVHFLQVWFVPDTFSLKPGYEQKLFAKEERHNRLLAVASGQGLMGGLAIHQDATMYVARLNSSHELKHEIRDHRGVYLYVAEGNVTVDGKALASGDAAIVTDSTGITIKAGQDSELVLFDVSLAERV